MALDLLGFQLGFTFKIVVKALDRDLHFVQCYIWGNTPTFCAHVIVSNLLWHLISLGGHDPVLWPCPVMVLWINYMYHKQVLNG